MMCYEHHEWLIGIYCLYDCCRVAQFTAFLNDLNVETIPTDMSFGVSEDNGVFEWGSTSFGSFVGKFSQLFSPWFWRLVFDIVRFNYFATDILSESWQSHSYSTKKAERNRLYQNAELESIGDYLDRQGYSEQFKRYYIIPMVAAPWCIDPEEFSRNFPAHTLIRFMSVFSTSNSAYICHGIDKTLGPINRF